MCDLPVLSPGCRVAGCCRVGLPGCRGVAGCLPGCRVLPEDMFNAALYCLVFMGQTHDDGITYVRDAPGGRRYVHWSDSDWAVRRSTTGGTGQLAGASVQATSRKQDCVSGSSTHAEIIAASTNSNDVVWARGYLSEIGLPQDDPSEFNVDAANVITLVHNFIASKLTRHITRRECIVREREADKTLAVNKVPTADNLADMFTKALGRDPFTKLRQLVINIMIKGVNQGTGASCPTHCSLTCSLSL